MNRYLNIFLLASSVGFFIIGRETGALLPSFMFGLCIGMIFLNYKKGKKDEEDE